MTVRFKGTELRPVLAEAVANQCRVILVKDQGVYFLAERGERRPDGRQKTIAYAAGCNPRTSFSRILASPSCLDLPTEHNKDRRRNMEHRSLGLRF